MLHILTLNYNGKTKLEKLYPTLINSLNGIEYSWHIRDNGSSDNSIDLKNVWNNDSVIFSRINHNIDGFATGCNYLFNIASPNDNDLILLLNNDITFNDTNSIKNMISLVKNDQTIGVVGAKLNYTNTDKLQHAGVVIDRNRNLLPNHFRANEIEDNNSRKNREFTAVTGAVLLTKALYYKDVSKNLHSGNRGMLETYFFCFEDVDLCYHIKYNLNKKIVFCGQTNIFHDESYTLKQNNYNKLLFKQNIDTFLSRWKSKCIDDNQLYLENKNYNLYK